MSDFTDIPVVYPEPPPEDTVPETPFDSAPDPVQTPGPDPEILEPVPETAPVPSPAPGDGETSQGVEETAGQDPVVQIDYTPLLNETNLKLDSLILEVRKTDSDLRNVQNAMPALLCMSGVIIGILLLHILVSYLRP